MRWYNWVKLGIIVAMAAAIGTLSLLLHQERRHSNTLETQVEQQCNVIDSLLARRMQLMDVQLWVTDKSKNIVYGRYNKGSISMPQERKYILVVDSINTHLKSE